MDASSARADLIDTFTDYGRALTVQRPLAGTYDPATGEVTYGTGQTSATMSSYPGIGRLGTYRDDLVDGARIKQNDRVATFIPTDLAFVPQVDDRLVAGSDVYAIVSIKTRELGGEPICYTLQIRR